MTDLKERELALEKAIKYLEYLTSLQANLDQKNQKDQLKQKYLATLPLTRNTGSKKRNVTSFLVDQDENLYLTPEDQEKKERFDYSFSIGQE